MGISPKEGPVALLDVDTKNFEHLALRALSELADEERTFQSEVELLSAFCDAFAVDDRNKLDEMLKQLRSNGVSDDDVIDKLIPSAARRIGEQWVRDELTFAQVTMSAARMQELARFLGGRRETVPNTIPLGFNALLVIPKEEQHTMGAFVAADQFRRLGLWVHLAIGQEPDQLRRTVTENHFSMVGISAAARRSLPAVASSIDVLKEANNDLPVILGGNIINIVENISEATKADLVTSNPREAVSFCGLPSTDRVIGIAD